ncbi:MAG: hypothetical protein ACE5G2_09925 [Candidatus Krumholzibacteriia bacterium]
MQKPLESMKEHAATPVVTPPRAPQRHRPPTRATEVEPPAVAGESVFTSRRSGRTTGWKQRPAAGLDVRIACSADLDGWKRTSEMTRRLAWFGYPLPVHPDEPLLVEAALNMVRTGNLNPHYFSHPSLDVYFLARRTKRSCSSSAS